MRGWLLRLTAALRRVVLAYRLRSAALAGYSWRAARQSKHTS